MRHLLAVNLNNKSTRKHKVWIVLCNVCINVCDSCYRFQNITTVHLFVLDVVFISPVTNAQSHVCKQYTTVEVLHI